VSDSEKSILGLAAWADLASVRRTIEWVSLDADRIEKSLFTGATVLRLLARIAGHEDVSDEGRSKIAALSALMEGFDASDVAARTATLTNVRAILDELVPLGELGARRHDLSRKARLSKPSRRDRRPRKEPDPVEAADTPEATADAAPEAAEAAEAAEGAPETPDASADPMSDGADAKGSVQDGEAAVPEEPAEPEPYAWLNLPKTSPTRPSGRAPRRLEWNHPEGTGRPISALGLLSEEQLAVLAEQGMVSVADFLSRPPVDHDCVRQAQFQSPGGEDDVDVADSFLGTEDEPVMVRGRLKSRMVRVTPNGSRYELVFDVRKAGLMRCAWVTGRPRGWGNWAVGMELAFVGLPEESDDGWALYEAEPVGVDGRGSGWRPRYGIEGVDDSALRGLAGVALVQTMGQLREPLPRRIVDYYKLIGLDEALRDAHFPSNKAGKGRNRLAFEELLLLQAGIGWRAKGRNPERGLSHKVLHSAIGDLGVQQNLTLTDSQEAVFSEIRRDLKSSHAMVRLLQGEVGTNKTTIALLTAAVVMQNKAQVLYCLPDAESAERRFLFSEAIFRSVGFAPALIPGNPSRGQIDAISRGEYQIIFGTKAMLANAPKWNKLGLVIVEERSEYGTVDPARLVEGSASPDLLVITDTPIPNSLTLTVFGEYRMSMLNNDYATRYSSTIYKQTDRLEAYGAVRDAIEEGRQAYVVFPVGEDGDLLGPDDALRYAGALQSEALEGARIGVYCSAMSRDDRLRVFEDFQHRRIDVLVATTFIEEAPLVANATVVVIEHADHHKLARLHRLRGHVGQGSESGQCLMVMSENPSADAEGRLTVLSGERDGFKIAEMDLKERGWDALLGDAAENPPVFRWADPVLDHQHLLRARDEAFGLVKQDPGMRRSREIVDAVADRWGEWLGEDFTKAKADNQGGRGRGNGNGNGSGGGGRKGRRRRRRR